MNPAELNKVRFHFLASPFYFKNRGNLKVFLLNLFTRFGNKVEAVNYIFCTDEYLLEINRRYLAHDTYTDIISFELSPKGLPLVSDVYISIDRVKENAGKFQTSFREELHRVIFHGTLHLCGLKDKTKSDVANMRANEEKCLLEYFVSQKTVSRRNTN